MTAMVEEATSLEDSYQMSQTSTSEELDCLPDPILLLIFNKLADIKSLGRCCAVCKRFNMLARHVEYVVVKVDCVIPGEETELNVTGKGLLSHVVCFVFKSLVKPLQVLQKWLGCKRTVLKEVTHHSPGEVLRNFKNLRKVRIELPGGELGVEEGVLLKWRAEFGSTLENCVILGAASMKKLKKGKPETAPLSGQDREAQEDSGSIPESFYIDGGLKLRVVWTISSLIAASARHYLLKQIIYDHPTLDRLVLTDAEGQGTLSMNKEQLQDFRGKPFAASVASSSRTQVPALNLKLWYSPSLELPDETSMVGATLVAIRPSLQPAAKDCETFVSSAFDDEGPFRSAACALLQRRTYLLEMNSF